MAVAVFPSLFLKKSSNPIKLCKLYRFFRLARIEKLVKELGNLFRAEAGDPNAASHQTLFDDADRSSIWARCSSKASVSFSIFSDLSSFFERKLIGFLLVMIGGLYGMTT